MRGDGTIGWREARPHPSPRGKGMAATRFECSNSIVANPVVGRFRGSTRELSVGRILTLVRSRVWISELQQPFQIGDESIHVFGGGVPTAHEAGFVGGD